jgi:lipopolysaccharide/colanic/teichoic acid biosynthesis glycosyltransferase
LTTRSNHRSSRFSELLKLKATGVQVQDGPDYYESVTGKIPLDSLPLSWLLFSPGFHVRPALRLYKRLFSFTFGLIGLAVSAPFMALAAIAIRLDWEGPIIFRQKRVGEYGMPFTVFKFRTMCDGDKVPAPRCKKHPDFDQNQIGTPVHDGDPRITRVGKWLRHTRLDELPQLFNIVRGDISFVGPRPVPPHEEEECAAVIPFYKGRWLIKPSALLDGRRSIADTTPRSKTTRRSWRTICSTSRTSRSGSTSTFSSQR